ncbi:hypothetical protein NCC78_25185 [Micromonospora phytophila]|uniref:hypothetical protein n=1 Tax=Micromonospora phytophila TaxID=709888 RepID=UPI00202FEA83|nr:hypothetical protein [Micromonospora phytophila]MCM0677945.1 hypothetical protein [Micromonospora phytophila]
MTMPWNQQDDPLHDSAEGDAVEQQQTVVDDPDADATPSTLPSDATAADVAEQGTPVPGERDGSPPSLPPDANPADVLEQRQALTPDDDERRT